MRRARKCRGVKHFPARSSALFESIEPRCLFTTSISGTVFNDLNANNIKDTGEPGLSGWTVYGDVNKNGVLDAGEVTAVSGANGTYTLSGVPSNLTASIQVREIVQPLWQQTFPAGGYHQFTLFNENSQSTNRDFGNTLPGNIAGAVFADYNSNGVKDAAEPGLAGWTVYIDTNNDGQPQANETQTLSAADGSYQFTNLLPGDYIVREVLPTGWAQTVPGLGGVVVSQTTSLSPSSATTASSSPGRQASTNDIVVAFNSPDGLTSLRMRRLDHRVRNLFDLNRSAGMFNLKDASLVKVALPAGVDPQRAVNAFSRLPGVKWAQPDYVYTTDPREFTPSDPFYSLQYYHSTMQNNLAWNTTLGSPSVIIAITDDGLSLTHPDLAAGVWTNPGEIAGNGIDDDHNGYVDDIHGWDFFDNDNNVNPVGTDDHGTHVAGIAAARTNNGVGVAGTAGGATIMPIRFYGSVGGSWTSTIVSAAFHYAVDNGAKIVSSSYNIDSFVGDSVFLAGLQYVYDHGALFFNSGGNAGQLNPPRQVFDQALLVTATTSGDIKTNFGDYGYGIDLAAPGDNIYSTLPGNGYGYKSGTSMSAPNAAGAAALIWSAHPTWTRDQVAAQLIGMADNIDSANPSYAGLLGSGRVNSYRAVTQTLAPPRIKSLVGLPSEGAATTTPPTSFTLDVANVLNPATVNNSAFQLRGDGIDNLFGTADDTTVPLSLGTTYMIGTNRLTFTIAGAIYPDTYRFCALPTLTDPFGQNLDGNSNGVGGDAFARNFTLLSASNPYYTTVGENQTTIAHFGNRDTIAPKITGSGFDYQSRQSVRFVFSENVMPSLDATDLVLQLNGNALYVPLGLIHRDYDSQTNTATFTFINGLVLPDGNYTASLNLAGVTDLFGNALETGPLESANSFFILAGDANHDRRVDSQDIYILASHFNGSATGFSDGDFNYDGRVDSYDLSILAARWQMVLT